MNEPTRSPDAIHDATRARRLCFVACPADVACDCREWARQADAQEKRAGQHHGMAGWARTWRRAELTLGEAEQFRAGVAAAQRKLYTYAENLRACVTSRIDDTADITRANASAIEIAADMLGRIEPSCEPDGLSERGA